MERVLSYWVQKRQSRNNVPLIRRLQANPQPTKTNQMVSACNTSVMSLFNDDACETESDCVVLVTEPGRDEPGTEGAAEGVAPPPS